MMLSVLYFLPMQFGVRRVGASPSHEVSDTLVHEHVGIPVSVVN